MWNISAISDKSKCLQFLADNFTSVAVPLTCDSEVFFHIMQYIDIFIIMK